MILASTIERWRWARTQMGGCGKVALSTPARRALERKTQVGKALSSPAPPGRWVDSREQEKSVLIDGDCQVIALLLA